MSDPNDPTEQFPTTPGGQGGGVDPTVPLGDAGPPTGPVVGGSGGSAAQPIAGQVGWFADPTGRPGLERYWDGRQFIDRTRPAGGGPAGWYPHPLQDGLIRYWEGSAWTDDS